MIRIVGALCARIVALYYGLRMHAFSFSSRALTDPRTSAVVCLTTFGKRVSGVHLAIESIGRGSMRPGRIILWLDPGDFQKPTRALSRAMRRGLEIRATRSDWGPHKKYFPYCLEYSDDERLLVTADDDVFYPRHWLESLVQTASKRPDVVWAHRARAMQLHATCDTFEPYIGWPLVQDTEPSIANLATGVGGVAYPVKLQKILRSTGGGFMKSCSRTDDIWLHLQALRNDIMVGQVHAQPMKPISLLGSQHSALAKTNQDGGKNDEAFAQTYDKSDITKLRRAPTMSISKAV